jgi:hypothetical protein
MPLTAPSDRGGETTQVRTAFFVPRALPPWPIIGQRFVLTEANPSRVATSSAPTLSPTGTPVERVHEKS